MFRGQLMNNYYDEYEEEIDLLEVWRNFLKKWKIGVIIAGVCALIGILGTVTYNKINKPETVSESLDEKVSVANTYFGVTTSDVEVTFNNPTYSEDGTTNVTLAKYVALVNTNSYRKDIVEDLGLKDKYNIDLGSLNEILTIENNNSVVSITVSIDKAWFLGLQDSESEYLTYTEKQVSELLEEIGTSICRKEVSILSNQLDNASDRNTYEVLADPVYTEVIDSESTNTTTSTVEVYTPKSVKKYTLIAVVLGVVIYCGYVFVLTLMDKTLKNPEDIKRYVDYPVLGYVGENDESYKSLAITLSNVSSSKVFNVVSPISNSELLVTNLAACLEELGNKVTVVNSLEELTKAKAKKTSSYILINSKAINKYGEAIALSNKASETIINAPIRDFSKEDLEVTKEIIKNNDIKVTGVVISGLESK